MASGLEEIGISDDVDELAPPPTPRRGVPVILLEQPVSEPSEAADGSIAGLCEWLARVPLLADMSPVHIERLAAIARDEVYRAGEYVYRSGEPGSDLFVVVEGTVRLFRTIGHVGDEAMAILRAGHHFGELCFLEHGARRLEDARVQHHARVLRLEREELRDLMFVDRELAHDLLWRLAAGLCRRVRESSDRLTMLASSSRFA